MTVAVLAFSGCSASYVAHVGKGQLKILAGRKRVEDFLQGKNLSADQREKIQAILETKAFGESRLGLAPSKNYTYYYQVEGPDVAYNLTVSPKLDLKAHSWCFPIVGCFPYLGYFDRELATGAQKRWSDKGYDTYVRPVAAYSTLGWFIDPIFSTLLRYDAATLAEIVLHEMVHRTIYVKSQGAFNESAATFIGERGALAYLEHKGSCDPTCRDRLQRKWQEEKDFEQRMNGLADRLRSLYASGLDDALKLQRREEIFREEKDSFEHSLQPARRAAYERLLKERWNNALLVSYLTYHQDNALWEAVLDRFHGDLGAMVVWLKGLQREEDPFARVRDWLAAGEGAADLNN